MLCAGPCRCDTCRILAVTDSQPNDIVEYMCVYMDASGVESCRVWKYMHKQLVGVIPPPM